MLLSQFLDAFKADCLAAGVQTRHPFDALQTDLTHIQEILSESTAAAAFSHALSGGMYPIAAPTGVAATDVAAPVVTWNAVAMQGVAPTGYNVYRDGAFLAYKAGATLTHTDATAVTATEYDYQVAALYGASIGTLSAIATATTP